MYVANSTRGYTESQWRFCFAMLLQSAVVKAKKELDDYAEDGAISTWSEMWRAFCKGELTYLLHHGKCRFEALTLKSSGDHFEAAGWRVFWSKCFYTRRYV